MSSIFSIFCGTTFSSIFHFFKEQYQCLQELTKHYSNATVEEKLKVWRKKQFEKELIEGYVAMAKEDSEIAEANLEVGAESLK